MVKIATVTLNPALDLVGKINAVELGEVNSVQTLGLYPAGKGNNVAKVLTSFGLKPLVTGIYGEDNRGDFDNSFKESGCENQYYPVPGKTRVNVKITEASGQVTDLNFQGFHVTKEQWAGFVAHSLKVLAGYEFVAVCGSLPSGVEPADFKAWLLQVKALGCKLVLDTSNKALEVGLEAGPFLIKPNEKELGVFVGKKLESTEEIAIAANEVSNKYGIPNVVVSMGAQGSLWVTKEFEYQAQPPKIENVVSTVGAGDSMVAGLIYGIAHKIGNRNTLRLATAVSAYAVTQSNVGFNSEAVLEDLKEKIEVRRLVRALFPTSK